MSTQEKGTPLYNIPDNIGYRLLELPPDLEKLLDSDEPPSYACPSSYNLSPYSIVHHTNRPNRMTLQHTDTAALLVTPNQSYSLRQKNTSNALILLKPHQPDTTSPEQGMAAVSEIHEFVELDPVKEHEKVAQKASVAKGKWHERFGKTR